ncbi:xanthine dehydrogenase family protein subunit M [bacterium]|nr:xanthine dehydrogenase family protein subunit M [bacterium]
MYEPVWRHPKSLDEAVAAIGDAGESGKLIAGGTDLAVLIHKGVSRPDVLVDLSLAREHAGVTVAEGRIELSALATHAEIAAHPQVRERVGLLALACAAVGSAQTRSRGTVGGNVANASPAADSVTALAALDADVHIQSVHGRRIIPLAGFCKGPGLTTLAGDELITGISFDLPGSDAGSYYRKVGQRNALAIAIVSVGATFDPEAGTVRLAFGSVAPTVVRARAAEELFESEWASSKDRPALVGAVARLAVEAVSPIDDVRATAEYRTMLVETLAASSLEEMCLRD